MTHPAPQIVTLTFNRFAGVAARLWAFAQMGLARRPMARTPGIGFWKLCGSGTGEGFTPVPDTSVYAILATWPDMATAQARMTQGVFARHCSHAVESWTVFLTPTSVRGHWSGAVPFAAAPADGPLAVLTRATVKPRIAVQFWRRVPDISARIGANTDVAFKIGIGEVPLLHQVTFSIWPSEAAMTAFARSGPHADAIRAVRRYGWFREELYARFAVQADTGTWGGVSPLDKLKNQARLTQRIVAA